MEIRLDASSQLPEVCRDEVEHLWVETRRASGLREDNDGDALCESFHATLEDRLQVLTGIGAPHGDRVPGAHDVPENRIVDETLLDHEGDRPEGDEEDGQDKGLQGAQVIADEHAGPLDRRHVVETGGLELRANGEQ